MMEFGHIVYFQVTIFHAIPPYVWTYGDLFIQGRLGILIL
jgi:hypothetical protein